jgi:hypothetical protein
MQTMPITKPQTLVLKKPCVSQAKKKVGRSTERNELNKHSESKALTLQRPNHTTLRGVSRVLLIFKVLMTAEQRLKAWNPLS